MKNRVYKYHFLRGSQIHRQFINHIIHHPTEYLGAVLILLVRFVWYKNVTIAQLYPDSYTYMNYGWVIPSNGRTPTYPYIINLCRIVGGESCYLILVVLVQIVASLVSLIFLYKLLVITTKKPRLALFITIFYGCSPTVMVYDTMIATESLSISGCMIFLYLMVRYIYTPSVKMGLLAILLMFILTMQKPSFLVGNYLLFGFLLLRLFDRQERRILKKLIPASICVIIIILIYSSIVNQAYGIFSITTLLPRHTLAACLRSGVYLYHPDQELVSKIMEIYFSTNQSIAYDTTTPVMELFGLDTVSINRAVSAFCSECIRRAPLQYIGSIFNTMINNISVTLYAPYATMAYEHPVFSVLMSIQTTLFSFLKIGHIYFLCMVEAVITLWKWIRKKQLDWIHLGLMTFLLFFTLTTFVGTYAEFSRSIIHALPLVVLSIALLLDALMSWVSSQSTERVFFRKSHKK